MKGKEKISSLWFDGSTKQYCSKEKRLNVRSVHCGLMVVLNNTGERKRDLMSDQFIVI